MIPDSGVFQFRLGHVTKIFVPNCYIIVPNTVCALRLLQVFQLLYKNMFITVSPLF